MEQSKIIDTLETYQRSTCIEEARMAFARVKTFWGKMKAIDVAAKSPPKGKDRPDPEHYFESFGSEHSCHNKENYIDNYAR